MMNKETLKIVEDEVVKIINPLGYDLIELKSIASGSGIILRFLIDRQEGGITLQECAQLNSDIGRMLDENNIISDNYTLEVSSPGIDRFLIEPRDFRRAINKRIHLFLKEEQDGKIEIEGQLNKVDDMGVLVVDDKNNEFSIIFSNINRAKQVIL
ncbi:MAG: ribosome maturation factor RimP [Candidatus Omnitrophota bacterium]